MKAIMTLHNWASEIVTSWWTPAFVLIFLAVLTYALWPTNRSEFDAAARMPLRED
jgi:cytochrome c oxidase cbb3-type subunit IV